MGRMPWASARGSIKGALLAVLAALCLLPAFAAANDKPLSAYYREIWTTRQGLPHNQINAIAQTPDGYLWLGTWEGLVRYNGLEFHVFDRANTAALKDNGVRSVRSSADGAVVIGTSRGGVTIKRGDRWQTLREADGLAQDEVMDAVFDRAGRLWVATESAGITRIEQGRAVNFDTGNGMPSNVMYGLLPDRDGSVWAATAGGLVHFSGNAMKVYGPAAGLPDAPVFRVLQTARGELLVGTERGVYRRMGERFQLLSPLLPVDGVPSLAEDGAGNLWVGTVNNGLLRLAESGVERFTSLRGLPNNRVAQYTNLGAGRYRFQVDASAPSLGHGWGDRPTSVRIEIAPRLWERGEFLALMALLLALLVFALYRWRLNNLRRRAAKLEGIVEQRTRALRDQADLLRESDQDKSQLLARLREQSEAFEHMALEDALTGIANRRSLDVQLAEAFDRAMAGNRPLSFALFDIDDFKRINDSYSHAAGDRALVAVAHVLRDGIGGRGVVARWGGEEFAALFEGMSIEDARVLCEALRLQVVTIDCSDFAPDWSLSMSGGVTERTGLSNHEKLVSRADALLYEAKRAGRNRICG